MKSRGCTVPDRPSNGAIEAVVLRHNAASSASAGRRTGCAELRARPAICLGVAAAIALAGGCATARRGTDRSSPPPANAPGEPARFGFGRPATPEEIARLDIDVRPDGVGLPAGQGTVGAGREIYAARCALCHGPSGTEGPNDRLVGRMPGDSFPFGNDPSARRTIGSYWPYATTLFDYIRRAMPFDSPGSLSSEQIYAVVAWLLFANELIPEDARIDAASLPRIRMPARLRFVPDSRKGGHEIR